MKNSDTLTIKPKGERELVMTRVFDAPRRMVFDAMTKPELVKRWLGVFNGWTVAVCEIDLKVGGKFRYVWQGPDGVKMGMGGVFREIVVPEKIVSTEVFDESWYPGNAVGTITLVENGGKTTMTTTTLYESREARDAVLKSPMEQGLAASYDNLEALFASKEIR